MLFIYPAIFYTEESGYSVSFPDLPGCLTEGDTLKEAMENAKDAMALYLEPTNDEPVFPQPTRIQDVPPEEGAAFVSYVTADVPIDRLKSVRKNCTIPSWLNRISEEAGINFSKTLQEALFAKLGL